MAAIVANEREQLIEQYMIRGSAVELHPVGPLVHVAYLIAISDLSKRPFRHFTNAGHRAGNSDWSTGHFDLSTDRFDLLALGRLRRSARTQASFADTIAALGRIPNALRAGLALITLRLLGSTPLAGKRGTW